jgi:cation diffusion facilitator CzcD-associated flavoprotein CzcO
VHRYLLAEKSFSKIDVFDQRPTPGGVWNYTPWTVLDSDFSIPRVRPTTLPDTPVWDSQSSTAQFVSPVYDYLETNIPHTLMNYGDTPFAKGTSLFPHHERVLEYLQGYAEDIKPLLQLETQVREVKRTSVDNVKFWDVTTLNLTTKEQKTGRYDAIVVASGHYNDPFVPEIPGLAALNERYPGLISHSKFYKRPEQYTDKVSETCISLICVRRRD